MYCKKCGSEIKEGNTFCTNCGTSINENNNKEPIKIKLSTFLILVVTIIIIFIISIVAFGKKSNSNQSITNSNTETKETIENETESNMVELGNQIETDEVIETYGDTFDDTTHLLEQIYAKYPELEGKDGIICSNTYNGYTDYWLLDRNGNKMYFTNIEGFEALLIDCPSAQAILKKQTNNSDTQSNQTNNKNKANENSNTQEYINIPKIVGLTEQQAIDKIKNLGIPYEITYREDLNQTEGIVLEQSYHYDVITDIKGDIVGGYKRSVLYPRRNSAYLY